MRILLSILLLFLIHFPSSSSNILHVHVVPHSHIDPGWLKTYTGYYPQVRRILMNVISGLISNPSRRFTWCEMTYLSDFLSDSDVENSVKESLRYLIETTGQIELVFCGWVMPDESALTYSSILTNLNLGKDWILDEFGPDVMPTTHWRIDPFGASGVVTKLGGLSGLSRSVLMRIGKDTETRMRDNRQMDFFWGTNDDDRNPNQNVLCTVLDFQYCEEEMVLRWFGLVESEMLDLRLGDRVNTFVRAVQKRKEGHFEISEFPHVLVPYGCDFSFDEQGTSLVPNSASFGKIRFDILEQVMQEINSRSEEFGMKVEWASPKHYFEPLEKYMASQVAAGKKVPSVHSEADFLPYTQNGDDWWTGYYSSWPNIKQKMAELEALLRNVELYCSAADAKLSSFDGKAEGEKGRKVPNSGERWTGMVSVRQEYAEFVQLFSVLAHHDAITGTSKYVVMMDYLNRARTASERGFSALSKCVAGLLDDDDISEADISHFRSLTDHKDQNPDGVHRKDLASGGTVVLYLLNSLTWDRKEIIPIPLVGVSAAEDADISICAKQDGVSVDTQRMDDTLWIEVHARPFSLTRIALKLCSGAKKGTATTRTSVSGSDEPWELEQQGKKKAVKLSFKKGLLHSIGELTAEQSYARYLSSQQGVPSGAYVFEPRKKMDDWPAGVGVGAVTLLRGELLSEVHTTIDSDSDVSQVTRVFRDADFVEIEHHSGPIVSDVEIVSRFRLSEESEKRDNSFSYLLNGLGPPRAVRSIDETPFYAPPHYRPFVTEAATRTATFLTSQAHGATVVEDGSFEVMLHRSPSQDDWKGMGEGLALANDVVQGKLRIFPTRHIDERRSLEMRFPILPLLLRKPCSSCGSFSMMTSFPRELHLDSFRSFSAFGSGEGEKTVMRLRLFEGMLESPISEGLEIVSSLRPVSLRDPRPANLLGVPTTVLDDDARLYAYVGDVAWIEPVSRFRISWLVYGAIFVGLAIVSFCVFYVVRRCRRTKSDRSITLEDFDSSSGDELDVFDESSSSGLEAKLNIAEILSGE